MPIWSVNRREALASSKYHGGRVRIDVPVRAERLAARAVGNQQLGGFQPLELGRECEPAFRLRHGEAAGRQIQPRQAESLAIARERGDQRFLALFQQRLIGHGAGGNDAHHLALDRSFGLSGVAELLADRDALAFAYELRQIAFDGVKRDAGHRDRLARRLPRGPSA